MGLLGNGFRHNLTGRITTATTAIDGTNASVIPASYNMTPFRRNMLAGSGIAEQTASVPDGCRHPVAWLMPRKAGGLSARNTIAGTGTASASAQSGYNISGTITGEGDIPNTVSIGLIVSIAAALTASGGISSATIQALASMVASITGSGSVSATAAGLAEIGAILSGSGFITANNTALMSIAASIRGYGDLTPEGIRDMVWSKIVEAGFSAEEILRLLAAHAAGSATGLEGSNPQFTGLDGTTIRLDGTYSGGTRTIDALNGE